MIAANVDLVRVPVGLYPKLAANDMPAVDRFSSGFECSPDLDCFRENQHLEPFVAWRSRLVDKATAICANRLSFFDLVDQNIGDPVDWHRDFSARKTAPIRLSNLIDYRDFHAVGDCKLVWEPNRHHQLVVLARAYVVTGDKAYAVKVVDLMCAWIAANPFGYGMNWKSPLEIGIRLINWVWSIDLIKKANVFDEVAWNEISRVVYLSIWDVQRKFSRGTSANNHLIGEAAGVFIAASYFPTLPHAAKWIDQSRKILEHELQVQSYADGCTREHAFGYQFFVIQFLTLSMLAGERSGRPFSAKFGARLQQMYRFMSDICADTGRAPNFGDADDGYVLDMGELPEQAGELISVGNRLFSDGKIVGVEESETAIWLLGRGDYVKQGVSNVLQSKTYAQSGYHILRTGSVRSAGSGEMRVFFDCAKLGFGSIAAHGHADCLSFTLAIDGQELLVDPGTFDYFTHPEWRAYFRSTAAHNTVMVDGECQSESLGPFMWGVRASARLIEWEDNGDFTRVTGEHSGYSRLPDPVVHRRTVTLFKAEGRIEVLDKFVAVRSHTVRAYYHTAPGSSAEIMPDDSIEIAYGPVRLSIKSDVGRPELVRASETGMCGWISDGYHCKRASQSIVFEAEIDGETEILTCMTIPKSGDSKRDVARY